MLGLVRGAAALALTLALATSPARAADHNDPNGANSIFADIPPSPADLYDLFGFPVEDASGERVVVALTFGAVPRAGTLDPDLLYRVFLSPGARVESGLKDDDGLEGMLKYFDALKDKYAQLHPSEVRVNVDGQGKARLQFFKLPGGDFSATIDVNQPVTLQAPGGFAIKAFVGGRDDAFFNDLPGFFRSINYAPQFYNVPLAMKEARELKIPKTLIELEGNTLFNFNPAIPLHGQGVKLDLPPGPLTWNGNKYHKDANGNYRFVYSGKDAQAGRNVNAIILEFPLAALTKSPATDRIVNAWGESWVLKAANKVETIPDDRPRVKQPAWLEHPWVIPCMAILFGLFVVLRSWGARGACRVIWRIVAVVLILGAGVAGMVLTSIGKQTSGPLAQAGRDGRGAAALQAGRHRRTTVRRRCAQPARRFQAAGRVQLLAGAQLRHAPGAPRLGLRSVDQRARVSRRRSTTRIRRSPCTRSTAPGWRRRWRRSRA